MKEPELKVALINFEKLISNQPDNFTAIIPFKNYLRNFLRIRTTSMDLPTSEIMTVLKHEKPKVYYLLKANFSEDPIFNFLTNIGADYDLSRKRLSEIKDVV
ncbi:hypothetical protein GH741_01385 [Aquibacillus halophilus]|uniref:Uncharacterized protein n=1 Tax=Aquibacillus halophilus TaxID=930132 RepID=A0A6A8D6T6_9BACI|nr:hypothetical protein [Aquibacillus halophilus]MRH41324.1 hypothetical protein [Aquibacillus halophilus]